MDVQCRTLRPVQGHPQVADHGFAQGQMGPGKLWPGSSLLRLPGQDFQLAAGNVQTLDMSAYQGVVERDVAQANPETVAAGALIDGACFAQARVPGANLVDLDVQPFEARDSQPALRRHAEQSRQGQPEQEQREQREQQPAPSTS